MADFKINVVIGGVEQTVSTIGEIEAALAATKAELKNVEVGGEAFNKLGTQAAGLQRELQNSYKEVVNFDRNIGQLAESVSRIGSSVTAAFSIATSAFGLFGSESEKLSEAQVKAQQALALALGATTLATNAKKLAEDLDNITQALGLNLTREKSAAMAANTVVTATNTATTEANTAATVTQTVATEAEAVATAEAAVAQEGLNAAMAANPIGLLLVGLAAVVSALVLFSDSEDEATVSIEEQNSAINKQNEVIQANTEQYISALRKRRQIEIATTAKNVEDRIAQERKLEEDILAIRNEAFGKQEDDQNLAYKRTIDQANNFKTNYQKVVKEVYDTRPFIDEFGVEQNILIERVYEQIGKTTLDGLKKNFDKEKAQLQKDYAGKENLQTEFALRQSEIEENYQIQRLRKLREFVDQADNVDREAEKKRIDTQIGDLTKQFDIFQKFLQSKIDAQLEFDKKISDLEKENSDLRTKLANDNFNKAKQANDKLAQENENYLKQVKAAIEKNNEDLAKLEIEQNGFYVNAQQKRYEGKVGLLQLEKEAEIKQINDALQARIKDIDSTKTLSKAKKDSLKADIQAQTDAEIASLNAVFDFKLKLAEKDDAITKERADAQIQQLKDINEILLKEVTFGDNNIRDSKEQLYIQERELLVKSIENDIKNRKMTLPEFEKLERRKEEIQKEILERRAAVEKDAIKRENDAKLKAVAENLEKEFNLNANFYPTISNEILKLNQKQAEDEIKILEKTAEEKNGVLTKEELARKALLQTRLNQFEEAALKEKDIEIKLGQDKVELERKTNKEILDNRLRLLDETVKAISAQSQFLRSTQTQLFFDSLNIVSKGISDFLTLSNQQFTNTFEKVSAYVNAGFNVIQGFLSALSSLNQAQLQQEITDLQNANNIKKDEYTTDYNNRLAALQAQYDQGLISQEQFQNSSKALRDSYDNSIKSADKATRDRELKAKKDAFEEDKKLKTAQAIIAGIQGALQAFTSAMQLGPIAGPIVGGILAAAVVALTAVQVSAIQKTQFAAGGTTVEANTPNVPNVNTGASTVTQASTGGMTQFNQSLVGTPTGTGAQASPFANQPQRVYVLESDITNTQNRVSVLESNSSFG